MKRAAWLLAAMFAAAQAQEFPPAPYSAPHLDALLTDADLDEISGLATSRRSDDLYWVHNDAPRPATLVAIDGAGRRRGSLRIDGVRAIDWEDLASYTLHGKSWLLIGDIGDNAGVRTSYELIAIEEPEPDADAAQRVVQPAWRLRFRYPDGAHDGEALAVDVPGRQILLLTKRAPRPVLYALPLGTADDRVVVARRLHEIDAIPAPTEAERAARFPAARHGGSPTSLDIDPDATRALVLTYRDIWIFARKPGEAWTAAFARRPMRLPLPPLAQAEAVGFDRHASAIRVSGERLPAPWIHFEETTPTR